MKTILFAVLDKKAASYGRPFPSRTAAEATRSFSSEVNSAERASNVALYPEDYSLYSVGVWDDETGLIESSHPTFVVDASSLVKPASPEA